MKEIKYICAVDSVYSLFLYFLLHDGEEDETLFIVSEGIPYGIRCKLPNFIFISAYNDKKIPALHRLMAAFRLRFSLNKMALKKTRPIIYAQDHLFYSFSVINGSYNLLEDGLGNYVKHRTTLSTFVRMVLLRGHEWGRNNKVTEIILTGIRNIPNDILGKTRLVDLKTLWNGISKQSQKNILSIFMEKSADSPSFNYVSVLLTQPFSEDGVLTENEKIELYANLINTYKGQHLVIKPHPRERTNYAEYFNLVVLSPEFPFQILLLTSNIKKIITCSSSIPQNIDGIEIDIHGTKLSQKLIKKYGIVEASLHGK